MLTRILILCTGNSCRSQMAHGFFNAMLPSAEIFSAGIEVHGLNPRAVKVMAEVDIDISKHVSEDLSMYLGQDFSHIITVCDDAAENCPVFPGNAIRLHESFPDPAKAQGTEDEIMDAFRRTRDLVHQYCLKLSLELLNDLAQEEHSK